MEYFAGYFFVFVEGVGVDVQCGGGLGVAQEAGYCSYIRAVGNQEAGVAVSEARILASRETTGSTRSLLSQIRST